MKRRRIGKLLVLLAIVGSTTFQAAGCTSLTGDQVQGLLNSSLQGFLNSLWNQWSSPKIDGLFNVD